MERPPSFGTIINNSCGKESKFMPKEFNVTAVCMPEVHYMVNIDERLRKVKAMVDAGKYFTIF